MTQRHRRHIVNRSRNSNSGSPGCAKESSRSNFVKGPSTPPLGGSSSGMPSITIALYEFDDIYLERPVTYHYHFVSVDA